MKFVLAVCGAPSQLGAPSAYHFAEAVLSENHQISQIFFYQDGVLHVREAEFFPRLNVPLRVCSTALSQRNILPTDLKQGFKTASLTQFFDALFKADRYVSFGEEGSLVIPCPNIN